MKKLIICIALIFMSVSTFSKDEPYYFLQTITITIDDVADVNAIPDLLSALGYPGGGNAAQKAAFIKAAIIADLQSKIRIYRIIQSQNAISTTINNTAIPIN